VNDGSTSFWESHDGLRVLAPITDVLAKNLPGEGFWSGNKIIETVMMGRLKGQFIPPLAAGLNAYREARECAFIYSAKPTPKDKPLMDVFALTKADIERAREEEAITQFVMRGAIRNPDYGKPYGIYLYSKPQAERLREKLIQIGFSDVTLAAVDVGVLTGRRVRSGSSERTAEEREAAKKARQKKDAERKRRSRAENANREGRTPGMAGRQRKTT